MDPIPVHPVFVGEAYRTEVWASEHALKLIEDECDNVEACLKKLKVFATGGFLAYEGGQGVMIRHEGDGAFRIRYKESSLFRMIGFYEDESRKSFQIVDAFHEPSNGKYTSDQRKRMAAVADLKKSGNWKKVRDGGSGETEEEAGEV